MEASSAAAAELDGAKPKKFSFFASSSSSSSTAAAAPAPHTLSIKKHCGLPVRAVRAVAKRTTLHLTGPKASYL